MWKVFPFRELSNQEPSGPRRQTLWALGLVIKALSVTAGVEQAPVGSGALWPIAESTKSWWEQNLGKHMHLRQPWSQAASVNSDWQTEKKTNTLPKFTPLLFIDWFSSFYNNVFIDSQLLLQLIWLCGFQPPFIIFNCLETSSHKSLIFKVSILFLFNV